MIAEIFSIVFKYWIEFACGALVGVMGFFFKRLIDLEKQERVKQKEDLVEMLQKEIKEGLKQIKTESDTEDNSIKQEVAILKQGVLSIQGKQFIKDCEILLNDSHTITIEEWKDLESEHSVYHNLGGNHRGDYLFTLIEKKVENTLT